MEVDQNIEVDVDVDLVVDVDVEVDGQDEVRLVGDVEVGEQGEMRLTGCVEFTAAEVKKDVLIEILILNSYLEDISLCFSDVFNLLNSWNNQLNSITNMDSHLP